LPSHIRQKTLNHESDFASSLVVFRDTIFRESPMKLHSRVMLPLLLILCLVPAGCGKNAKKVISTAGNESVDPTTEGEPASFDFTVQFSADRKDYVVLADDDVYEPKFTGRTVIVARDKVAGFGAKDNGELMDRFDRKKIHVNGKAVRKALEYRDPDGKNARVERVVVEIAEPGQLKVVE
jgi:hypothetical protein